ncbi:hypothetical protein D9M69_487810 [compost metagenome]
MPRKLFLSIELLILIVSAKVPFEALKTEPPSALVKSEMIDLLMKTLYEPGVSSFGETMAYFTACVSLAVRVAFSMDNLAPDSALNR